MFGLPFERFPRLQPARRVGKCLAVINQPTHTYRRPAGPESHPIRQVAETCIIPTKTYREEVGLQLIDITAQSRQSLVTAVTRHSHRNHFDVSIGIGCA